MMNMQTLTPDQRHIETLRTRGARIRIADGNLVELNSFFVDEAINICLVMNANAITYEMELPGFDIPMAICIWRTGHIDSGSLEGIQRILDR